MALPGVAVTVVDNDSPDASLEAVADLPVQAIQSGRNAGFGAGCNIGAAAGSAPFILLVNPDAELTADALSHMLAVMEAEPDVALVGPRMLDESGGAGAQHAPLPAHALDVGAGAVPAPAVPAGTLGERDRDARGGLRRARRAPSGCRAPAC